jgi:glycosyltransferase involved in cell wall biosynthesis
LHIIALVENPQHVCARYRLSALQSHWASQGHRLELRAIPAGFLARWHLWRSLAAADAVILQRRLLSRFHLLWLRRHARRLIFDFDDAVFLRDSYTSKHLESTIRRRRFLATVQAADVTVAGNDYLAQEAARYIGPQRVRVIPTCVEPQRYPLATHQRVGPGVQLVWIGSSSTLQGLEQQQALLEQLGREVSGIQAKIICDRFPVLRNLPVLRVPWSEATETAELAGADIGISWIPDDRWSQGKCGLKVLQYLAAGLPVVSNRVGVQAVMVRHGENGYLADTPAQWVEAVRRLAHDAPLRQRMGRAGRQLVEQDFSVTRAAERWLNLLEAMEKRHVA